VALGKTAATAAAGKEATLPHCAAKCITIKTIPLIVTIPAYLLRSPLEKNEGMADLNLATQLAANLTTRG